VGAGANQVLCVAASGLLKSKPPTAIHVFKSRPLDRSVNSLIIATSSGCAGTTSNEFGSINANEKNRWVYPVVLSCFGDTRLHWRFLTFQDWK
jgi:hypothetical protein